MLVIRKYQLDLFRGALEADFRNRLHRHIRELCPFLDDKDVDVQVSRGMEQAQEFGFRRECDIARFVELVCVHRGGLTAQPLPKPALAILYGNRTNPGARLERFRRWCEAACPNNLANVK